MIYDLWDFFLSIPEGFWITVAIFSPALLPSIWGVVRYLWRRNEGVAAGGYLYRVIRKRDKETGDHYYIVERCHILLPFKSYFAGHEMSSLNTVNNGWTVYEDGYRYGTTWYPPAHRFETKSSVERRVTIETDADRPVRLTVE